MGTQFQDSWSGAQTLQTQEHMGVQSPSSKSPGSTSFLCNLEKSHLASLQWDQMDREWQKTLGSTRAHHGGQLPRGDSRDAPLPGLSRSCGIVTAYTHHALRESAVISKVLTS